jgi:hypothetical protein
MGGLEEQTGLIMVKLLKSLFDRPTSMFKRLQRRPLPDGQWLCEALNVKKV